MSGNTREQLRAVFLAFVMVTSVLAAGVAFSGSAAASGADGGSDGDSSNPAIVEAAVPGSTGGDTVFLSFDEGVFTNNDATGSIESGDLTLTNDLSSNGISGIEHTPGSAIVEITLNSQVGSFDGGDNNDITVTSVFDASGNQVGGGNAKTDLEDNEAPKIAAVEAEAGSSQIEITFTEPVDNGNGNGVEASDLTYSDNAGPATQLKSVTHTADTAVATATLADGSNNEIAATQDELDEDTVDAKTNGEVKDTSSGNNNAVTSATDLFDSTVPLIDNANTVDSNDDGTVERIDIQLTEPISNSDSTLDTDTFSPGSGSVDSITTTSDRSGQDDSFVSVGVSGVSATATPTITITSGDLVDASAGNRLGTNHQFTNTQSGLRVSTSPSSAVRGETVSLSADINNIDGSDYTGDAQVAILGLTNANDDGNPNVDSNKDTVQSRVLASGSTSSGTFTTSITLNGQDRQTPPELMDEYAVVVRKGTTGFSTGASDTGSNPFAQDNTADTGLFDDIQGQTTLSASPNVQSDVSSVERGSSSTITGSVTVSDGSGIDNFPIAIRNLNTSSNLGSGATTASNGDFSTTVTFADAAQYSTAANLYDADINSLQFNTEATFDVTPQSATVSNTPSGLVSTLTQNDLVVETEVDGSHVGPDNETRVVLSGVEMSSFNLDNAGADQFIDKVIYADGTELGTIGDGTDFNGETAGSDTNPLSGDNGELSSQNIQEIVLFADGDDDDTDKTVQFDATFANTGTLDIETQVEDIEDDVNTNGDTSDTPTQPDRVGTASVQVNQPSDLNNGASVADGTFDAADSGTDRINVDIANSDGEGLLNSPSDNNDIKKVDVTLEGINTEIDVQDGSDGDVVLTGANTPDSGTTSADEEIDPDGPNLNSATLTLEPSDIDDDASESVTGIGIVNVDAEQNGTINVTTKVTFNDDTTASEVTSISVEGDNVTDVTPSVGSELTVGPAQNFSVQVTDGTGSAVNNRQVFITDSDGLDGDEELFKKDLDDDGTAETIDAVKIDGAVGQIFFSTDDDSTITDDASDTFTANNGIYAVNNLQIDQPSKTIDIRVEDNGPVEANLQKVATTSGERSFNLTSDTDPMVAGFQEQINITVTNRSTGNQTTGGELRSLLSSDDGSAGETIQQGGSDIIGTLGDGTELGTNDLIDRDNDGTDDAIQASVTPTAVGTINMTLDNGDGTKTGSGTINVVAPAINTNLTDNTITERLQTNVEIQVLDPRDGSRLFDTANDPTGATAPDLRFKAFNGTIDIAKADQSQGLAEIDQDGSDGDQAYDDSDDGGDGEYVSDISEANQTFTIAAFQPSSVSGNFTLEVSAQSDFTGGSDDASHFGDTNSTIESMQVTTDPDQLSLTGGSQSLSVTGLTATGEALSNRRVDISGAGVSITGAAFDNSGFVASNVEPQSTGNVSIFVDSDSDLVDDNQNDELPQVTNGQNPSGASEASVVVATDQQNFDVSVSPQNITANQSSTVTVTATNNGSGNAVESASVSLSGAGVNTSAQTGANGEVTLNVNASQGGSIDVTVDSAGFNSATATITVEEAGTESASVTFNDQSVQNGTEEVTVASANYTLADGSEGDYVVVTHIVFDNGSISDPVGVSSDQTGSASDITVDLNDTNAAFEDGDALDTLTENTTLRAMLHETSSDSAFGPSLGLATDDADITVTPESPLEGAPGDFDTDGNGDIDIGELGDAGTAFAQGELTIAELGAVGQQFAS